MGLSQQRRHLQVLNWFGNKLATTVMGPMHGHPLKSEWLQIIHGSELLGNHTAFLPLIKRSKGRFVSISSVAGRVSVPCGAPYSVAKYGVEAYMDAIRLELECWGIGCCILEPGMFRTKLIDATAMTARVDKAWQNLTTEIQEEYGEPLKNKFVASWNRLFKELASDRLDHVVDAYFHAVTARFPRYRYRVGWDAILLYIPYSFLPTGLADFVFRTITQLLSGDTLPAALEKQKNMLKKKLI